ncbi:MAG: RNA-binding domain-containing protein [Candidatus Woesearchaeota archaeon]|jgi:RNA binding exosome subunit|nr:hypothetical protein [Candidatus Woesearchaeota archaeon]MDP6647817.1 RNA-binding domain-containing protein [Candidatus Woesearchaeota archaeon]|tara:strand:- start:66 stop:524 length:459 start_codon:yes stop_codon:yes gene_type:complete
MAKTAHQIKIKVFSYEKNNEDNKLILDKFLEFFPFNLEDEKIELKKTEAEGFHEKKIKVFEATLIKEKHIKNFLENLNQKLDNEEKNKIISQLDSRLDDNLDFYLRFDKGEYLKKNELKLTDSGNCFHVRMSIAAFPKKRDIGLGIVKDVFV